MLLQNKTIVVTGCSSGIGAEVARYCRQAGACVVGLDRNDPMLTLDAFIKVDLNDPASIDAAVAELPERFDALCNVAGVPSTADAGLIATVNYLGLRHLTERALPRIPAGGAIVNVSSILGYNWPRRLAAHKELAATPGFEAGLAWIKAHPAEGVLAYEYFKEALIVWTFIQAQSWFLGNSVRMNCVAPGPVFTPILKDFVASLGDERVQKDAAKMKRPAYADEIAPVVAFLCSDGSRWINGANVPVDGGLASTYV